MRPLSKGTIMNAFAFILTLLVGFFAGGTTFFFLAYFLDSYNKREIKRRSKAVADYVNEYGVSYGLAYNTLEKMNFDL